MLPTDQAHSSDDSCFLLSVQVPSDALYVELLPNAGRNTAHVPCQPPLRMAAPALAVFCFRDAEDDEVYTSL